MKDHSWIIEAIEREAFNRAGKFYAENDLLTVAGLGSKQVLALKRFYEKTTGRSAHDIEIETKETAP